MKKFFTAVIVFAVLFLAFDISFARRIITSTETFTDPATIHQNQSSSEFGAVFYNEGTLITNAQFLNNKATGEEAYGGAIFNNEYSATTIGSNVVFSSNSAGECGGAINNFGTTTIGSGAVFNSNSADKFGGAIYNYEGTINLTAKTKNIEFSGNKANGISNAIHDKSGTINLWTKGVDIIFNDRITSEDNSSTLTINKDWEESSGKVIINENMRGYKGNVHLYSGILELGKKGFCLAVI